MDARMPRRGYVETKFLSYSFGKLTLEKFSFSMGGQRLFTQLRPALGKLNKSYPESPAGHHEQEANGE
jgi:hypothetical protein